MTSPRSPSPPSSGNKVHVKGQPHFPCLGQNSFPFARMKTEQKTSSGNRVQAPFPEPFIFPKTEPWNRKETMREQFGKHRGNLFREQYQPHRGNPYWDLLRCPRSNLIQSQNAVIPGLPAHAKWFQKEETTAWNRCRNRDGNGSGNHDGNHDRNHEDSQIGNRVGDGGRRGKGEGNGGT